MTRTPRVTQALRDKTKACVDAAAGKLGRKTILYTATGLALAGAGAATAGGLAGTTATAASQVDEISKMVATAPPHQSQNQAGATSGDHATTADHSKPQRAPHVKTWLAIERIVAHKTSPITGNGQLPAQDRLTPDGTSGPQSWLPMTQARYDNASTIVRQALHKKMGLRSAVIAVATAMQESTLLNINHGDRDSLGLFQQRPSAGWGSAGQILRPAFAADAFLDALHSYQSHDPGWAGQPLWQDAQNVQESGFPYAYAKWEAQSAHLVTSITHSIY